MTQKQKRRLTRILVAFAAYLVVALSSLVIQWNPIVQMAAYFCIYLYIAWNILKKTWKNLKRGDFMDENFLMATASLGAFLLGEYSESVAVVLFYEIGEWFQDYALDKSRKNIADLMDIAPEYANLEVDGKIEEVSPDEVQIGQTIVIQPGERVPLDGVVLSGTSSMDTSALTGESVPRSVKTGDSVISGCINQNGVLKVKVTSVYEDSTVARILDLVENATDKKSKSEQFITKFARYYTPVVVYAAIALAVIPSFVTGDWPTWVYRALEFLVISCPCALVISVPLSFFGGIGAASRDGILVKGSNYLQEMTNVKTIVFDKTGTLTKGTFAVTQVEPADPAMNEQDLLNLAARVESFSTHPIAQSILRAAGLSDPQKGVGNVQEVPGKGVIAPVDGRDVYAGNARLMEQALVPASLLPAGTGFGTVVYLAEKANFLGMIEVADEPKEDAKVVLDMLKTQGIQKFVMLTGDHLEVAQAVANADGVDEVHAGLLPSQKVEWLEKILEGSNEKSRVAYVGDGINDAPVLTRADIGIAMGGLGSDAAIEAADIVLMDDQLDSLVTTMQIARKTMAIAYQNIVFAIGVKVLMLLLGALGIVNMWGAVFADVGVSFLCIINSIRALRIPKWKASEHRRL